MKIADALTNVKKVFLDTAPVIFYVEKNPAYLTKVEIVFLRVDAGQLMAATSPITLAECLVQPIRLNLPQAICDFQDLVVQGSGTHFVVLDENHALHAAELRVKYNLRLPDAMQLAAAILSQCDAFLTNDVALKRVAEIPVLVLDDLEI